MEMCLDNIAYELYIYQYLLSIHYRAQWLSLGIYVFILYYWA